MSAERWKPVVGFEGSYEVSDLGRVRSLDRTILVTQRVRGGDVRTLSKFCRSVTLRPGIASHGYPMVVLGGKAHCVHEIVLTTFRGPRPSPRHVCRHLDGDRQHSALVNLAWGTPVENRADADRHGTSVRGERYRSAKLTDAAAREIRKLRGRVSQSALAERFNVSPAAVQAVHDGRTWRHV